MTELYPGSKKPVRDWEASPAKPMPQDVESMLDMLAETKYLLPYPAQDSEPVQFYTTGAVGFMLGRSAQTVRNWITKDGIMPEPAVVTTNHNVHAKRYLFSRELMGLIYRAALEAGILTMKKGEKIRDTGFTEALCKLGTEYWL